MQRRCDLLSFCLTAGWTLGPTLRPWAAFWKTYAASSTPPTTTGAAAPGSYWAASLGALVDGGTPADMLADMLRLSPMTDQAETACGSSDGWLAFVNSAADRVPWR